MPVSYGSFLNTFIMCLVTYNTSQSKKYFGGNCDLKRNKMSNNCSSGRYTCRSGRIVWKLLKIYLQGGI